MIIRLFVEGDMDECRRLCSEFSDMIKDMLPPDLYKYEDMADDGIEYWLSEAAKPDKGFFVAETGPGRLAGFIQGHAEDEKELRLSRWGVVDAFFIEEEYRGQRIGADLLGALENWFAGQNCVAARVATWLANAPATEAYKAMGFVPYAIDLVKELPPK